MPIHAAALETLDRASSPASNKVWRELSREAVEAVARDALMAQPVERAVLRHADFPAALSRRLALKLCNSDMDCQHLVAMFGEALDADPDIVEAAVADLLAIRERDPASPDLLTPFLYFKGYHALQVHRVSHWLWQHERIHAARFLQSRSSEVFGTDIHPAARLGRSILLDHATGVVIGETAVVEDDVSMLQEVTLGGTGKECGDRHPKVRRGVLLGAGAKVLGNIEIGEGAKVGAGSIVLEPVAPYTTVVGVPARPVGPRNTCFPALTMDQTLPPPDYSI